MNAPTDELVETAARIFCEEALTSYRAARDKAAAQLGLSPRRAQADPAAIQAAVIRYQRLFGGNAYLQRLAALRNAAVRAMKLLQEFDPRLTGAAVSGAITGSHRVQLHAFADKAEQLDWLLQQNRIAFEVSERRYRFADGRETDVPVLSFGDGDNGVDVAMFSERDRRSAPLCPLDHAPMKRLTLAQAEALASPPFASPQTRSATAA